MARPTKPSGEVASIESEIAVLRTKLADHEHRHADALAALEDGREARRKLLTKDDKAVAEATRKVRELQFAADDAGSLVADYRNEIADAERRLIDAKAADQRESAAATMTAIADASAALVPDLIAAVKGLADVRAKLLAAMPENVGLLPGYHAHRPAGRPEGHSDALSGREVVNALIAECLFHADATMFDQKWESIGTRFWLAKLVEIGKSHPTYVGDAGDALSPAQAVDALIVKPARERARQILAGEVEPVLEQIRQIDRSKPPELPTLEIIATKPLVFIAPNGTGHFRHHISEGRIESVIEPIARLAIAKRAALELDTPAGQAFQEDYRKRLKAGEVHPEPRRDTVDLGDSMGCLEPANDDIADEVERALG